jgi:hypothetical protein
MSAASGRARAVRSRFTCSGCRLGAQQQSPLFQGNRLDLGQRNSPAHYWVLRQHLCGPGFGWVGWCRSILVVGCGVCLIG